MIPITTRDTSQDCPSLYADIEQLPRLTAGEEAHLLADLRLATRAPAAKARLIEGYLPRVLTLARCYDRRYRVITFDDLVQEGSLALMQAIDKCATMPITTSLSRYIGTVVRSAFARAIGTDAPIHMPNSTWHFIHKSGRAQEYAWMQTMRLDASRHADGETFAETIPAPALLLPDSEQEQRQHEQQRRQLAALLALLSERQRRVLTLHYGLDPADARCHGWEETARVLGLSLGAVYDAHHRAMATLRHASETLAAAESLPSPGPLVAAAPEAVTPPRKPLTARQQQYHQRRHAEQQARLEAAWRAMQEQGLPITGQTLKERAEVSYRAACTFVQAHPQSAGRDRLRALTVQLGLQHGAAQPIS